MKTDKKTLARQARQRRVRAKIAGTQERPRISIFRSNTALSAQVIDDTNGKTLATISTSNIKKGKDFGDKVSSAGVELANLMKKLKITEAVFDRGGYAYIGNIKVFADAIRQGGIKF